MAFPLAKLFRVPPLIRAALKARQITTCDQLLAAAGHFEDRAALARASRLDLQDLNDLVRQADLARIQGIGVVFGRMLKDLGIHDVALLAQQEPAKLHQRLRLHNEANRLARRAPTEDEVTDWIDQARALPSLVSDGQRGQEAAN